MKSQIFVIIFLMSCLAKGSEFNSSLLSQSETSANESEKNDDCYIARGSLLPANTRFDMVFTSGLRGTLYGGTIGLLAASIDRDADNLGYIFYPAIGLSLGLLGGLTYGILSEIDSGFDSGRLNLGLSVCYEAAMSEQRKYGEHYSCTFRYPNHNHFFPDNYNFNVGYEEWETVPGEFESRVNQYKYGIEFTKTNYCVSFSSLYGLGIGLAVGDYKKYKPEPVYKTVEIEEVTAVYIDFLLGVNLNLLKFLNLQIFYKYEPLGIYNVLEKDNGFSNSVQHSVAFSAKCFLY